MSYILEALRRAETERERKRRVPGLHAQPVPVVSPDEPGARRSKPWLWVVAGVSAGVLLPLLWRSWPSGPEDEEAGSARVAVAGSVAPHGTAAADNAASAPPAAAATPTAEPAPAPPATAAAPAQPAQTTPAAAATAKPGATRSQPRPAEARPPTTMAATNANPGRAAPSQSGRPAPATAPAPPTAPEPPLRSLAELPEELRRGVPQLAFGGSVYSEIATQRMVIFNGQVLREGDAVTDDLLVEQIRPRSAVMRVRGQRFEITF